MAKIRGVKPEFWTDEDVCELSIAARLLFIGTWNFACDNGHLQDKPKQIKRRVMPDDLIDAAELLDEIEAAGLIGRTDGWITIPNLAKHQKPHKRWWTTCEKPGCTVPEGASHQPINRGATVALRENNRCATADGDGEGDVELMVKVTPEVNAGRKRPSRRISDTWTPNDKHAKYARERNLDLDGEADSFRNHALMHDRRLANWDAGFTNWLKKAYPRPRAVGDTGNGYGGPAGTAWGRPFKEPSDDE